VQHIDRHQLNSMLGRHEDLTLVEVLNERPYREFHLPGAINVPFGDGFDEHIQKAVPDKTRPVVVYCSDTKCQASTKASRQMDSKNYCAEDTTSRLIRCHAGTLGSRPAPPNQGRVLH